MLKTKIAQRHKSACLEPWVIYTGQEDISGQIFYHLSCLFLRNSTTYLAENNKIKNNSPFPFFPIHSYPRANRRKNAVSGRRYSRIYMIVPHFFRGPKERFIDFSTIFDRKFILWKLVWLSNQHFLGFYGEDLRLGWSLALLWVVGIVKSGNIKALCIYSPHLFKQKAQRYNVFFSFFVYTKMLFFRA